MRNTIILALGASVGLSGCFFDGFFDRYDRDDDSWADYGSVDYGSREATWTELNGDLGGRSIALADVRGSATTDYYGSTIEVETIEDGTWVLFQLSTDRDLADPALADGTVLSSDDEYVSLMGCTGPAPYDFDYDGYADDVRVVVMEGDAGQRRLEIRATFRDGGAREVSATVLLDETTGSTGWDDTPEPYTTPERDTTYAEHATTWTELSSELGPTGTTTLSAVEGSAWSDGYQSEIRIDTVEDGRWTMFALSLDRDLDDIEPGETVSADMLGCVGPSRGSYDYDGHDWNAQLTVEAGPTQYERIGHITATFDTEWGSQTVNATVRYEIF